MAAASAAMNPAVLAGLTLKWNQDRANLDDTENRQRINYTNTLRDMKTNYDDTTLKSREGFSDRGMLQSGPAAGQAVKLQTSYNEQMGDAAQAQNLNLATIARNRLYTDQEYNTNKTLAALGLV